MDAYRERLLQEMQTGFAQVGVVLGQGLAAAMEELYRDCGELRITVLPEKPLGMLQLMTLSPDTLASTLGLSLYVNDRLGPDLGFRFDPQLLQQGLAGGPGCRAPGSATAARPATRVDPTARTGCARPRADHRRRGRPD